MIDSGIYVYESREKLEIADFAERKKWETIGLTRLKRESNQSNLSLTQVSNAIKGKPVRPRTL
jgi:hypothetical protein